MRNLIWSGRVPRKSGSSWPVLLQIRALMNCSRAATKHHHLGTQSQQWIPVLWSHRCRHDRGPPLRKPEGAGCHREIQPRARRRIDRRGEESGVAWGGGFVVNLVGHHRDIHSRCQKSQPKKWNGENHSGNCGWPPLIYSSVGVNMSQIIRFHLRFLRLRDLLPPSEEGRSAFNNIQCTVHF